MRSNIADVFIQISFQIDLQQSVWTYKGARFDWLQLFHHFQPTESQQVVALLEHRNDGLERWSVVCICGAARLHKVPQRDFHLKLLFNPRAFRMLARTSAFVPSRITATINASTAGRCRSRS